MSDDPGHPANPYADEAATAPRLADREGYPFAVKRRPADLSDEAQIGATARCAVCRKPVARDEAVSDHRGGPWHRTCVPIDEPGAADEGPTFTLHASDPLAPAMVRLWVVAKRGQDARKDLQSAWLIASAMEEWRRQRHAVEAEEPRTMTVSGHIKFWYAGSGYGFIEAFGRPDVMFLASTPAPGGDHIERNWDLRRGMPITVEAVEQEPGKWRAVRVLSIG